MKRNVSSRIALAVAAVAAVSSISASRLSAETRIISSDQQSRFMALGVSKSVVVEVSRDIKDIVVADRTIATAVALTQRRVEIIGAGLGQTNVFLFDSNGRQIEGFDVAVKFFTQPHRPQPTIPILRMSSQLSMEGRILPTFSLVAHP